jgi:4-diphosphocytidyl-2-C-methyl-D-erythritol kinase
VSRRLVLRPSAKINLTLHVGPRRADGFHDVRTVMQSIALSDRLTLELHRGPFELLGSGGGASERSGAQGPHERARWGGRGGEAPRIKMDRTNLVWRAAARLWRALGRSGDPAGVRVTLEKRIPAAAGLGGGSADAAAALSGLQALWRARLPRRTLIELAAELGSDVPFFLIGGTALALGRGEEVFPLADARRAGLVVIAPAIEVSTADAYGWFDEDGPGRPAAGPLSIDLGWPTGPLPLVNDLQAPVMRRHPGVLRAIGALREAGAQAAAMSGSGSAVYGLFAEAATARAARRLSRPGWQVFATRTLSRREASRRIALC